MRLHVVERCQTEVVTAAGTGPLVSVGKEV